MRIAFASLAGVAILAVALSSCATPTSDMPEPIDPNDGERHATETGPLGPARTRNGVPQGWRHDAAGARAAAIAWVALTGDIARAGFITRTDMIRELATAGYAPRLINATEAQLDELLAQAEGQPVLPEQLVWIDTPVTARVVEADEDTARIEVWSAAVVGVPDGVPQQAWRTVTVDVLWQEDDWRLDHWAATEGPTPALPPEVEIATTESVVATAAWPSPLALEDE
jgi:hypothetical protein